MEKFDPGAARVYPLPQRDPMRTLADWGAPPDPPIRPDRPGVYERPWDSPGPPPGAAERAESVRRHSRPRVPAWAVALVMVGVLLLCVAGAAWVFFSEVEPPGPIPTPTGSLTTSPAKL